MDTMQNKYANKIALLLRKAEDPACSAEESEAFVNKAQALMTRYAIEEAMIDEARGDVRQDTVTEKLIPYLGVYQPALWDIGKEIGRAQNCKVLISRENWRRPPQTVLYLVGFESDIDRAIMLDASVQLQAQIAMRKWAKAELPSWLTQPEKFKARRQFLFSFAEGLRARLAQAAQEGKEEFVRSEAPPSVGGEDATRAGMELVLRSRKDQVQDWYDEKYGRARGVSRRYDKGGFSSSRAGYRAGMNANTGHGGALRNRGALNA